MPDFDPYYEWLGIPPKDQPAHHYRLLGVELFEEHRSAIDAAANRLMAYLQELSNGEDATLAQKLLNEVAAARLCLLNAKQKASYDHKLKAILQKKSRKTADSALPVATPLREKAVPTPPPVATAQIIADSDAAPLISTEEGQTGAPAERAATSRRTSRRTKNKETKVLFAVIGLLVVAAGTLVFFYANKPATKTPTPSPRSKSSSKSAQERVTSLAHDFAHGRASRAGKSNRDITETCKIAAFLVSPYRQQLAARDLAEQEKFCKFAAQEALRLLTAEHGLTDHDKQFADLPDNANNRPRLVSDRTERDQYDEQVSKDGREEYRTTYTQEFDKKARQRLGVQEK
jgi:hypothetical protein